ncbi:signal peptidase I [Stetteria hydrogenophila]
MAGRGGASLLDVVLAIALLALASTPLWAKAVFGAPTVFAVVQGQSMEPILHSGDLVFIIPKKPEDIRVGDIVVYRTYGAYVIHRVVYVYKDGGSYCFVTWGDNRETNKVPDFGDPARCRPVVFTDPYTGERVEASGVPYSSIVGVAVAVRGYVVKLPYIGSVTLVLR